MKGLITLLILSSIAYIPNIHIGIRTGRNILVCWGIMLLTGWVMLQKRKIYPISKWVYVYLIWSIYTTLIHTNKWALATMQNVFIYILLYWLVVQIVNKDNIHKVFNAICIVALFQVFWCGMQYYEWTREGIRHKAEINVMLGYFTNRNMLSVFLALIVPAFLRNTSIISWRQARRVKWWWFLPLALLPFLQRSMKGGFIALLVGLIFWVCFQKWNKKIIVGVLCVILGLGMFRLYKAPFSVAGSLKNRPFDRMYYISNHLFLKGQTKRVYSNQLEWARITTEQDKIPIVKSHRFNWLGIIRGHGLGQFKTTYPVMARLMYKNALNFMQAHNEYLQLKYEQGWIGVSIIMGFFVSMFMGFWVVRHNPDAVRVMTGVVIISVNSMGNFPFHVSEIAVIGVVMMGMMEIFRKETQWI